MADRQCLLLHKWSKWQVSSGPPKNMRAPKWQNVTIVAQRSCKRCGMLDWKTR